MTRYFAKFCTDLGVSTRVLEVCLKEVQYAAEKNGHTGPVRLESVVPAEDRPGHEWTFTYEVGA